MNCHTYLGQILINMGKITEEQLNEALENQQAVPSKKLGQILVQMNLMTESEVLEAMAKQFGFLTLGSADGTRKEWTLP